jgi:predicted O-methyltransferase YrrM
MWNNLEDNQGAFTLVFSDFIKNYTGGQLITVDISQTHMDNCKKYTEQYGDVIEYVVSDSVSYLTSLSDDFIKNTDFIFFDSYDLNLTDPIPSEIHHLRELLAVYDRLSEDVILAVDDNLMPGNWIEWLMYDNNANLINKTIVTAEKEIIGKGTLINRFLLDNNWKRTNDNLSSCLLGYER